MTQSRDQSLADVTVVIPCFNCEDTIDRAVASVAKQTLRPKEVVIVDDCSQESTKKKLSELQEEYGRDWLKVLFLDENGGPSVARNTGWDRATQPYLAFLDSDDSWHPQKLEMQMSWMESHPEASMTGVSSVVLPHGAEGSTAHVELAPEAKRITKRAQFVANRFATSSVMLKTSLPYRFQPERRYAEDNLLWLRIILDGNPAYKISCFPLVYYYKPKFGVSGLSGNMYKMLQGQLDTCVRLWRESRITMAEMVGLYGWQVVKYVRRVLKVEWQKAREAHADDR